MALATWSGKGSRARVIETPDEPTGAAYIFVNDVTGENAIIVVPGAGGSITPADVDPVADTIRGAAVFITQLEQPVECGEARPRDRPRRRRDDGLQSGPGGAGRRCDLSALRLRHAERERGGAPDRRAGEERRERGRRATRFLRKGSGRR